MGVDIYAGPLCRYYAEEWEPITVSSLKPLGIEVKVTRPGPLFPESSDRSVILSAVNDWKKQVVRQVIEAGLQATEWSEGFDLPYATDKPNDDGLNALRIVAAYSALGAGPWPANLPESVDQDPAISRYFNYENENLLKNIELTIEFQAWIPVDFRGALLRPNMPNGHSYFIARSMCCAKGSTISTAGSGRLLQMIFRVGACVGRWAESSSISTRSSS